MIISQKQCTWLMYARLLLYGLADLLYFMQKS